MAFFEYSMDVTAPVIIFYCMYCLKDPFNIKHFLDLMIPDVLDPVSGEFVSDQTAQEESFSQNEQSARDSHEKSKTGRQVTKKVTKLRDAKVTAKTFKVAQGQGQA
jgi:hypothetical protein